MCYDHSDFFAMPFSLTNGSTTFQQEMTGIFRDQLCHFVHTFLDVTLDYSDTFHCCSNEHLYCKQKLKSGAYVYCQENQEFS